MAQKWFKYNLQEEALKYDTKSAFNKGSNGACRAAKRLGVFLEITEHMPYGRRIWTVESLTKAAAKYNTRNTFIKKHTGAARAAKRLGIYKTITAHMVCDNTIWTREKIHAEALLYTTRNAFKTNSGSAYTAARRLGILKDVTQHMQQVLTNWTLEKLIEAVKPWKTAGEFKQNNVNAYSSWRRHPLKDEIGAGFIMCDKIEYVYVYYFTYNGIKYAYVGKTNNLERRHIQHESGYTIIKKDKTKKNSSPMSSWFNKIPLYYYQCSEAIIGEATPYEQEWMDYFKSRGFILLNVNRAQNNGIKGKYSKKLLIKLALQYDNRTDFRKYDKKAYTAGFVRSDWDEITKHMPKGKITWNRDKVIACACLCSTRGDLWKKYGSAYNYARKHNMMDELFPK